LERLIAQLCVEGIFFSSPFAFIFWIRKYYPKLFLGIVAANDLISRDENQHCEYGVEVINTLLKEGHTTLRGPEIFSSAVTVAIQFVENLGLDGLIDLNVDSMSRHVKAVANRWAKKINLPLMYPDCRETPFRWMEEMSVEIKKNFFEKHATEYQKAPVLTINYNPDINSTF
jgi:ribonucleotide reductase beta subunit family protein with ferritin-like domain